MASSALDPISASEQPERSRTVAEQALLGCLLLDNTAFEALPAGFSRADLSDSAHRLIFRAIAELLRAGKPADVVTVFEQLEQWECAVRCGGLTYLQELQQCPPPGGSVGRYAAFVQEKATERRRVEKRQEVAQRLAEGADLVEVRALLDRLAEQSSSPASPPRFSIKTAAEVRELPPLSWRIHGVLPAAGIAGIFGPSGAAKSFLALDMAAAIGEGAQWFGHRVKPACALYVALEGEAGFRLRLEAWEVGHERAFPGDVRFLFDPFRVTSREDVLGLASAIEAAGGAELIVIDTLNRAAPDADENSAEGMGGILDGVKALQMMTGGLVLLVHHTGKDAAKGMRGHSSLFAAMDAAIEVARNGDSREWKVAKSKDGKDGQTHPFGLAHIDLGHDEEGEPFSSCCIREPHTGEDGGIGAHASVAGKLPRGGNQKIVYDALGPLLKASRTYGCAGAPPLRTCIKLEEAIEGTKERLTVEPKRRSERARQAITALAASGVLVVNEGWLWLA